MRIYRIKNKVNDFKMVAESYIVSQCNILEDANNVEFKNYITGDCVLTLSKETLVEDIGEYDLRQYIIGLNIKESEDFGRFMKVSNYVLEKYSDRISRGRCEEFHYVLEKLDENFEHFSMQGYESIPEHLKAAGLFNYKTFEDLDNHFNQIHDWIVTEKKNNNE